MSEAIASISKNSIEDIRVSLSKFKGRRLVDVRTYVACSYGAEGVTTKKGVALAVDPRPVRLAALEVARQQTHKQGEQICRSLSQTGIGARLRMLRNFPRARLCRAHPGDFPPFLVPVLYL